MNTLIDIGINLTNMPRVQYCRNEPAFLPYVAQAIARIKKIDISEVAAETTKTARKFFSI
jgi:TatD DNase family protein